MWNDVFTVINCCLDMFRPQLSVIFRDLASAAYVSTYVGEILQISVQIKLKLKY